MRIFGMDINVQRVKKVNSNSGKRNLGELFYSMLGFFKGSSGEVIQPNDFSAMVKAYKHYIYICTKKNSNAIAQLKKRLYVAKGRKTKLINSIATKSVDKKVKDYIFTQSSTCNLPIVRKAVDIEEIVEHPYLDLMKNVNSFENQFGLFYSTQMFLELTGNSYWYVLKNNFGRPSEIWILPAQYMVIVPSNKTFISGYLFKAGLQTVPFDIDEIIHFKFSSPISRYYGMSPLAAIAFAYNTEENMNSYESGVFKNYGVPFGAFETKQEIDDVEFERIKKQIDLEFKGSEKSGKIGLFDKGITFKTYQIPPRDLAFLQGHKLNREVIFAAYDVPISKISPDSKYANQVIGEYQYMKDAINPRMQYLQDTENERLLPLYDDYLFIAYENPIPEDKEFELKKNVEYVKNFIRPINEIRNIDGLDKVPWGDVPWGGFNLQPLGSAPPSNSQPPEQIENYLNTRLNNIAEQLSKDVIRLIH